MAPKGPQTKSGRKLGRDAVLEILERNARLYKDENTFVPYLVELALYLLEYEYDWSQSAVTNGTQPGRKTAGGGAPTRVERPVPPPRQADKQLPPQAPAPRPNRPAPADQPPTEIVNPNLTEKTYTLRPPLVQQKPLARTPISPKPNPTTLKPGARTPRARTPRPVASNKYQAPPPAPPTAAKMAKQNEVRDLLKSIQGFNQMAVTRICPHCGARIHEDEHICPQCYNLTR